MEWIERHPVITSIAILFISYLVQALYTKWRVTDLTEWQKRVDERLKSIDLEINQIKISDAREGVKMENVTNELTRQTNDLIHMKAKLDDVHNMMTVALMGRKIGSEEKDNQ